MHFNVLAKDFHNKLSIVNGCIKNPQTQALKHIYIKAIKADAELNVMVASTETSMKAKVGSKIFEVGEICVPAEIVNVVKGMDGTIEVVLDGTNLILTSGKRTATFRTLDPIHFPKLPKPDRKVSEVKFIELYQALNETSFCIDTKAAKPGFQGFQFNKTTLSGMSTARASKFKLDTGLDCVLPYDVVLRINKLQGDAVTIYENFSSVYFHVNDFWLIVQKIAEQPSDFSFDLSGHKCVTLPVKEIESALSLASSYAKDSNGAVLFSFGDKLVIKSTGGLGEYVEELDIKFPEKLELWVNGAFLTDFLKLAKLGKVSMYVKDENSPIKLQSHSKGTYFFQPMHFNF